jgi:hypothetical protein
MISDVICLPIYDRVFCILTIFFTLAVHQTNIRAFYKTLYGVAPNGTNDFLYTIGIISCFALPLIGLFDESIMEIHGACAGAFFGCTGIYAFILGGQM